MFTPTSANLGFSQYLHLQICKLQCADLTYYTEGKDLPHTAYALIKSIKGHVVEWYYTDNERIQTRVSKAVLLGLKAVHTPT